MILIVDDKPENLYALKEVLELNKFEVDTAASGEEALRKVLKKIYALIILDVQMPEMDGFEVAEAISGHKKTRNTPIIFLSAVSTHKKFITKGYTSGAIDYITKPVDPDILMLKVKTFYRLYEQTNDLTEAKQALQKEVEVRKDAELALSNTVKELHSILKSIPQIAFTASSDGHLEFVNEHWYNYSDQKAVWPATYNEKTLIADEWAKAVQLGRELELEVRIKNIVCNEYRYHLLRATPVIAEGKTVKWVGTFTDINHQKQINEILERKVSERTIELQQINRELEASNHDLQQFASVASHDLKEPLRKIQVFSNLIKDRQMLENKDLDSFLNKVIHSSARMNRLINDLLNYSRLSEHHFFEPVNLSEVLLEILSDLEILIAEKNAEIQADELPVIQAIPGLIRQLFQNLIGNALKFSRENVDPRVKVTAFIKAGGDIPGVNREGDFCVIAVADNGIGFNERYVSKIFTLFQRLNEREKYDGTGIGLAIAKKIVDKHNGYITATGKENEGATFTITLPVKQNDYSTAV